MNHYVSFSSLFRGDPAGASAAGAVSHLVLSPARPAEGGGGGGGRFPDRARRHVQRGDRGAPAGRTGKHRPLFPEFTVRYLTIIEEQMFHESITVTIVAIGGGDGDSAGNSDLKLIWATL